jgi:azurin
MKLQLFSVSLLIALLGAGCAKNEPSAPATSPNTQTSSAPATAPTATSAKADPAKSPTAPAATAAKAPAAAPRVIEITANDQMKFSVTTIEAKPGEQLKVVLTNVGTLPKEAMGHNWVLLKPGTDGNTFSAAAVTAKDKDYIPDSMKDSVIAHTALLGPRKSDEVTFTVPAAGEYPFICSFPAHFAVGMKGVLIAK